MIMYPPESDVFAHAAEDLREQRRVLRVEEVAVEGVLAERRVHQQALRVISLTHAYQQTTIAHQHVHVGVVALRVRVTDLTHLLQRLHGHGRVGDVFEHLVALLQLVALRGVLAQRLLALWVSASLLAHLLLQEGPHDALRVLQLTPRHCRYHQQVLCAAHRHLVRLESRREGASSVRLLAVALDAVEEDVLHARHVLALQLWVTWLEESHLLVGLWDVLLQEQHDGGQRNQLRFLDFLEVRRWSERDLEIGFGRDQTQLLRDELLHARAALRFENGEIALHFLHRLDVGGGYVEFFLGVRGEEA